MIPGANSAESEKLLCAEKKKTIGRKKNEAKKRSSELHTHTHTQVQLLDMPAAASSSGLSNEPFPYKESTLS